MSSSANDSEVTVNSAGYQLTFYPGFARIATVQEGTTTPQTLFEQSEVYHLPANQDRPNTHHFVRLVGGSRNQDVTLRVDDPKLRIASITVELYGTDYDPSNSHERQVAEKLSVQNDPAVCPPKCTMPV